jgi:hypothetical protein
MNHCLLALPIQLAAWLLTGSAWAGCAVVAFGFWMREVAQAEYRWIEAHGGLRSQMPWWMGLDMRLWTAKSLRDFISPALFTAAVAAVLS